MSRAASSMALAVLSLVAGCSGDRVIERDGSAAAGGGGAAGATSGASPTGGADTCAALRADCDGDGTCETALGTVDDCDGCGRACVSLGGRTSCVEGACVASCDAGFADCNGLGDDGCEATLASDPDHCGACDVRCDPGDDCFAGTCLRILAIAQAALVGAESLVLEGGALDWATPGVALQGQIARVPTGGGPTTALVTGLAFPEALHQNGRWLVWSDAVDPVIRRMALPSGPGEDVLVAATRVHVLDVDDTDVYFTSGPDLLRVPIAGGAPTVLATGFSSVVAGDLDGDAIYFADLGPAVPTEVDGGIITTHPQGTVLRWSASSGAVDTIATDLDTPWDVAVAGDTVYWVEAGSLATYDVDGVTMNLGLPGRLARADRDGAGRATLADGLIAPVALAVDATHVYWASQGTVGGVHPEQVAHESDGDLLRIPIAGGVPEVVVPDVDARDVVIDDDAVYFASWYFGIVARVSKP